MTRAEPYATLHKRILSDTVYAVTMHSSPHYLWLFCPFQCVLLCLISVDFTHIRQDHSTGTRTQPYDCTDTKKVAMTNMCTYFARIHKDGYHDHNNAKYTKTLCIFHLICCISYIIWDRWMTGFDFVCQWGLWYHNDMESVWKQYIKGSQCLKWKINLIRHLVCTSANSTITVFR